MDVVATVGEAASGYCRMPCWSGHPALLRTQYFAPYVRCEECKYVTFVWSLEPGLF